MARPATICSDLSTSLKEVTVEQGDKDVRMALGVMFALVAVALIAALLG